MIRRLLERLLLGPRPEVPRIADPRSTLRWMPVASSDLTQYIGHPVAVGKYAKMLSSVSRSTDEPNGMLVVLQGADGLIERHIFAVGVELPVFVDVDDEVRR